MRDIEASLITAGYIVEEKGESDFPKGGLTLADIDAFINEAGGESSLLGKTTEQVCPMMKDITKDCSYCEYLSKKNNTQVICFMYTSVLYKHCSSRRR